jgi:cell shape-determining protein MreC
LSKATFEKRQLLQKVDQLEEEMKELAEELDEAKHGKVEDDMVTKSQVNVGAALASTVARKSTIEDMLGSSKIGGLDL